MQNYFSYLKGSDSITFLKFIDFTTNVEIYINLFEIMYFQSHITKTKSSIGLKNGIEIYVKESIDEICKIVSSS